MNSVSTVYTEIDPLGLTNNLLITEYCLDGIFCFTLKNSAIGPEEFLHCFCQFLQANTGH